MILKEKKRFYKKIVGLVMIFCMVLSMMPVTAKSEASAGSTNYMISMDNCIVDIADYGNIQFESQADSGGEGGGDSGREGGGETGVTDNMFNITAGNQAFSIDAEQKNRLVYASGCVADVTYAEGQSPELSMRPLEEGKPTDYTVQDCNIGTADSITLTLLPLEGYKAKVSVNGAEQEVSGDTFTYTYTGGNYVSISLRFEPITGLDDAAPEDAIQLHFVDTRGNACTYAEYKNSAELDIKATLQYSYDNSTWYEFTTDRVDTDNDLYCSCAEDAETHMSSTNYYFPASKTKVYFKVTAVNGEITNILLNPMTDGVGQSAGSLELNQVYELTAGNTYDFVHDSGICTVIWNSGEETDADHRLTNGRVKILSATLNGDDVLYDDADSVYGYSQAADGSSGHVGIKKGATVTAQLIPNYRYHRWQEVVQHPMSV